MNVFFFFPLKAAQQYPWPWTARVPVLGLDLSFRASDLPRASHLKFLRALISPTIKSGMGVPIADQQIQT